MRKLALVLRSVAFFALVACHHSALPTAPATSARCPGTYAIVAGACAVVPLQACRGLCGIVVRRGGCAPINGAMVIVEGVNLAVATDKAGQFDIAPIPAGHYKIEVTAEQDTGLLEIDATGDAQPLTSPLELRLADRSCECGGACPT